MLRHSSGCLRGIKKRKAVPGLSHLLLVRNMFGSKFPGKQGQKRAVSQYRVVPKFIWILFDGFVWMRDTEQPNKACF